MKEYNNLNNYCFNIKSVDCDSGKENSFRLYINNSRQIKMKDVKELIRKKAQKMISSRQTFAYISFECSFGYRFVIDNYFLEDFINNNSISRHCINVQAVFPYGMGAAGGLGQSIKLEIRARETEHQNRPHVHVYKRKNRGVSIALWNISVLCGEVNWEKEFSPKERREIIRTISSNKDEFAVFYTDLQKGLVPESVRYTYLGDEYWLKCKD